MSIVGTYHPAPYRTSFYVALRKYRKYLRVYFSSHIHTTVAFTLHKGGKGKQLVVEKVYRQPKEKGKSKYDGKSKLQWLVSV